MKKFRVKNYSAIARKAPVKIKAKGKVRVKSCYGGGYGGYGGGSGVFGPFSGKNAYGNTTDTPFVGPTLQQRLYAWAIASTLVTVDLDTTRFRGRVISVDGNGFEVTVTDPLNSGFMPGAIVYVNFKQVNAVSAG